MRGQKLSAPKEQGNILQAPRCFHGRHATANDTHADHDPAHPDMRAESGHHQIRRQVKDHIADVKQGETGRDLMRRQVQHGPEVVAYVHVHRLCQTNIGSDGRAEKVQYPEGRDDSIVQFSDNCEFV